MAPEFVQVRIRRPHMLPAQVTGERNVWLVYLRSYGNMGAYLSLRASTRGNQLEVEFLDGRGVNTRDDMDRGFYVRRNSTKHKILAALEKRGITQIA